MKNSLLSEGSKKSIDELKATIMLLEKILAKTTDKDLADEIANKIHDLKDLL